MNSPRTTTSGNARRLLPAAFITAGLLLVSCSSAGDETAEVTITPLTDDTTTSTEPTTTTAEETTTVTSDPKAEAEELIRASSQLGREHWVECTTDPADCDPELFFAQTSTGQYLRLSVQAIENMQEEGRIWRHPDDIENNDFVRIDEVTVADALLTATATVCERDGRAGWIPGPDGELVMLDETYGDELTLAERSYVFEDGVWKIDDTDVIAKSIIPDEEPVCDPEN